MKKRRFGYAGKLQASDDVWLGFSYALDFRRSRYSGLLLQSAEVSVLKRD